MGTHAPGLNALLFLALGAKGPPPACSAQKEGGIPASVSGALTLGCVCSAVAGGRGACFSGRLALTGMRKEPTPCENTMSGTASARGIQEGVLEEVSRELLSVPIRISVTGHPGSPCETQ